MKYKNHIIDRLRELDNFLSKYNPLGRKCSLAILGSSSLMLQDVPQNATDDIDATIYLEEEFYSFDEKEELVLGEYDINCAAIKYFNYVSLFLNKIPKSQLLKIDTDFINIEIFVLKQETIYAMKILAYMDLKRREKKDADIIYLEYVKETDCVDKDLSKKICELLYESLLEDKTNDQNPKIAETFKNKYLELIK